MKANKLLDFMKASVGQNHIGWCWSLFIALNKIQEYCIYVRLRERSCNRSK